MKYKRVGVAGGKRSGKTVAAKAKPHHILSTLLPDHVKAAERAAAQRLPILAKYRQTSAVGRNAMLRAMAGITAEADRQAAREALARVSRLAGAVEAGLGLKPKAE
jgi:hypothetical protein